MTNRCNKQSLDKLLVGTKPKREIVRETIMGCVFSRFQAEVSCAEVNGMCQVCALSVGVCVTLYLRGM